MPDCEHCDGSGQVCTECNQSSTDCTCDMDDFWDDCPECDGTGNDEA